MDTLANYVFLVKKKIQQKKQGENGFSAFWKALKISLRMGNGGPCR
jgi:hypothetical protein